MKQGVDRAGDHPRSASGDFRPERPRRSLGDMLVARLALLDTVLELRDHLKCIVFSTHIMREGRVLLCDRIAIVHRGSILEQGSLNEYLENSATA